MDGSAWRNASFVPALGMQMPDAIHRGQMNHVEVHEVAVVGQQIVGAAD